MADGSITIDTALDNSGIESDLKELQNELKNAGAKLESSFNRVGTKAQSSLQTASQSVHSLQTSLQQTARAAGTQLAQGIEQGAQQATQSITLIDVTAQGMTTRVVQAGEQVSQALGDNLTETLQDVADTVENINEPLENLGDTLGDLGDDIEGLGDTIDGLGDGLDGLGEPLRQLGTEEIEQLQKELKEAEKSTQRVKESFSKLSAFVSDALGKIAKAAGAAFSVAVGASVKVGMDFESGMSQVAATMGITTQEIASGSKEFEALSQAAKNAGATTQFSATQASEALNYLALASYDAEKSIAALPIVLNLAAAGGIELGYASDMITDSMSALGLETSQLEGFVDQLAKTSQKSNTNIAQLGEGILTVGGTAKDLAGGTIELNTALGILADNGVKASEGGTALRNIILSLSAPTDKAASEMERLGLEVFDANGKLRPLNETFQDLDGKLKQMTDQEKINVLNTLFNKVDLKSVNALLANSGKRFDELSGYIRDSAGAAADMAETMNDNLKGKLTILGNALEGLGIKMYQEFQLPLKESAETAIASVDNITRSLKSGKLSDSMQTVAIGIGNIVSKGAELAINTLPKLIDGFAFLVDHAGEVGIALATAGTAVAAFKGVSLIRDIGKSLSAATAAAQLFSAGASTSLTGVQAAAGIATRQFGLLQGVTAALGGPMGVAAVAIAGVTAGLVALSLATNDEAKAEREARQEREQLIKTIDDESKVIDDIQNVRKESLNISENEISTVENQIQVLDDLVDANGKVKEGQEGRVKVLADEINSVLPNAITLTEKEGETYVTTAENLEKLIKQKKINAVLEAGQESYTKSLKERPALLENLTNANNAYKKALEEVENIQNRLNNLGPSPLIGEKNQLKNDLKEAQETVAELKETLDNATEAFNVNEQSISSYVDFSAAVVEENSEKIDEFLQGQLYSLKQYGSDKLAEAQKQYDESVAQRQAAKEAYKDIDTTSAQEYLSSLQKRESEAKAILENAYAETNKAAADNAQKIIKIINSKHGEMVSAGEYLLMGLAKGMENKQQAALVSAAATVTKIMNAFTGPAGFVIQSPSKWAFEVGGFLMQGLAKGISKNNTLATNAAGTVVQNVKDSVMDSIDSLSEQALLTAKEQTNDYKEMGSLFSENYLAGLQGSTDEVVKVIQKNVEAETDAYEKAINEQTNQRVEELQNSYDKLKETYSDKEKELQEQKKKTKSEARKKELDEEIKASKKELEQIKKDNDKLIKQEKDSGKERISIVKENMKALEKAYTQSIDEAYKAIEKEAKTRIDAVTNEFQKQKDDILSLQEGLYSKTSEYGELFHYDEETGDLILNDLEKNTKAANDYYDALDRLENKGVSQDFVKMIATEYDVEEGAKLLNELLSMGDERLQAYVEEWEKLQEVSTKRSQEFLSGELIAIEAEYNKAMDSTIEGIKTYTTEVLQSVWNELLAMIPEYAKLLEIDPTLMDKVLMDAQAKLLGSAEEIAKHDVIIPIKTEVESIPEKIAEQTESAQQAVSTLNTAVAEQIDSDGNKVTATVDDVAKDSIYAMEKHENEFQNVGVMYIKALINGMLQEWGNARGVAQQIAQSLKDDLEEVASFSVDSGVAEMVAQAEPAQISRLYQSMVDSVAVQQSKVAAAGASYITNNHQTNTQNTNLGDINFNIEAKENRLNASVDKLMQQAEFYRRQRNLAVGVK